MISGHDPEQHDWGALAGLPTLVVLMGGRTLPQVAHKLLNTGLKASDTPVSTTLGFGAHFGALKPIH